MSSKRPVITYKHPDPPGGNSLPVETKFSALKGLKAAASITFRCKVTVFRAPKDCAVIETNGPPGFSEQAIHFVEQVRYRIKLIAGIPAEYEHTWTMNFVPQPGT